MKTNKTFYTDSNGRDFIKRVCFVFSPSSIINSVYKWLLDCSINSAGLCIMINYSNFLLENSNIFASRRYNIINRKTLSWTILLMGVSHRIHDGCMKCEETSFRFNTNDIWQSAGLSESAFLCHLTCSLSCSSLETGNHLILNWSEANFLSN